MAVQSPLLVVHGLHSMALLLLLDWLLLEILLIIWAIHTLILVHELLSWIILKLIARPTKLIPLLIFWCISRVVVATTNLLEALHPSHVRSLLVWCELTRPILHKILLVLVLGLGNTRQRWSIWHLLHIYMVMKIIWRRYLIHTHFIILLTNNHRPLSGRLLLADGVAHAHIEASGLAIIAREPSIDVRTIETLIICVNIVRQFHLGSDD